MLVIDPTSAIVVIGWVYLVCSAVLGLLAILSIFLFLFWRIWFRMIRRTRVYRQYTADLRLAMKVVRQVQAADRQAQFNAAAQRLIAERAKNSNDNA